LAAVSGASEPCTVLASMLSAKSEEHRTRGHVLHEILEERTRGVDGVEALGITLRQVLHAGRDHAQAGLLEAAQDLADEVTGDAVGFDDGKGALERHESFLCGVLKGARLYRDGPWIAR
jgi:hypothetical protein